jgi:hypothetical protein
VFHILPQVGAERKLSKLGTLYHCCNHQLKCGVVFLSDSQKREGQLLYLEIAPMLNLCKALQYPSEQGGPEFAQMHIESQQGSQCALYEQIYDEVTKFVYSECKYISKLVEI